ncbi:MAG: 16S rRNA processing protein RimM [Firmicutes bacterium]|nr:16S rRNA processing protein RimM [Bacillota bacterium]
MEKIKVGKIVNAVGLKGEVKVYNYSDSSEIYEITPEMYIGDKLMKIENVRLQKNMVILKIAGMDDRNAAEAAKGREIFITEDDLPELKEGEFYIRDLIGMVVTENEVVLGKVKDVIQNTAQDVFEIERENGKQLLIPRVDEFVLDIDLDTREIKVSLPDGLLDL